jgi:hypothetical protein
VTLVSEKELVEAKIVDPELCEVKKCIRLGWLTPDVVSAELKPYYAERGVQSVFTGVVRNDTMAIPMCLRNRVVKLAHKVTQCCRRSRQIVKMLLMTLVVNAKLRMQA